MRCELYTGFLVQDVPNRKKDRGYSGFDIRRNLVVKDPYEPLSSTDGD
jgi:hypothetical protein